MYNNKKQMTSYLDREKNDDLSWDYIWFQAMDELKKGYLSGNILQFRRAVDNLEISLFGKIDALYKRDFGLITYKYAGKKDDQSQFELYGEKARLLVALLDRATRGELKISEAAEDSEIIKEMADKMINGVGQNCFITGSPGSGKSWACGSIGEKIVSITNGKFNPQQHITFTPGQFLKAYNNQEMTPPGSVLVFEEVTVSGKMNNKQGMSAINMILGDIMQTIRYRRLLILFNAPDLGGLDKPQKKLLHWWLMTDKLDRKNGICTVKPHVVAVNQRDGEIYFQNPRFDRHMAVTYLHISKPSQHFIDTYEPLQQAYKDELAKRSEERANALDQEREPNQEEMAYIECRLNGNSRKECSNALKRGMDWGSRVDTFAKSKGFIIPDARGRKKRPDA